MATTTDKIRVNFYMKPELEERVRDFANEMGIDKGAAFSVICASFFEQRDKLKEAASIVQFLKTPDGSAALRKALEESAAKTEI